MDWASDLRSVSFPDEMYGLRLGIRRVRGRMLPGPTTSTQEGCVHARPIVAHMSIPHSRPCLLTLVDLAEDYNTREFSLGVVGDLRVEGEDSHAAAILGGDILIRLLDQHFGGVDVNV